MKIFSEVKEIKNILREELSQSGAKSKPLKLGELVRGGLRVMLAKHYLRKCHIGKLVSIKGVPKIGALGKITIGDRVRIWSDVCKSHLYTIPGSELFIDDNARINGVHISAQLSIHIGKNVRIAPNTVIIDSDFHSVSDHFAPGKSSPVVLEDDVWVGMNCVILKGVRIGKNAVIAAGSVVTKNVPAGTVYAGVPAKFIKKISDD